MAGACHAHALQTLSSLRIKEEYSYVVGRLDTLEKIFKDGCFNHSLGLKMLQLGEKWNYEFNKEFIRLVIEDLTNNKPVYAVFEKVDGAGAEDEFTRSFVSSEARPYSMYVLEMAQILAVKDITVVIDTQKKMPPGILIYKIQRQNGPETDFTTTMKRSVNRIIAPPMDAPRLTRLGPPHVGAGSGSEVHDAPKVLLAGHWRNRHAIKVGKRKTLAVVKYNGVYVPVSFVEHVSKR